MELAAQDNGISGGGWETRRIPSYRPTFTVERHLADGFTLWTTDREGYLCHRRFIGYSVREAKVMFRAELVAVKA